jgi:TP901 family phage tail tape measure protein
MGYDGSLKFDTAIDTSGFQSGLAVLSGNLMTQAVNKVVELGKGAIEVGSNFETATSQLAATMGVSKDEITALIDKAKELGSTTSFSATEAAEGLNILAMSGLNTEEQVAAIGDVLNLAAAGSLSLADAASYTTGAIKGFSDSMDNAQYYTDLIAKGATLANTNVAGLGEALSDSAATAASYGQTAEGTTLALLRLAEQNVTGSEAATALNRAMADLYTPTSSAAEALEALGVSAYDGNGKARDFNEVIDELTLAMEGMSEEEANATKNAIFTSYGLQAFNKMTVSSTEQVDKFKDGLSSASDGIGSAAEQAETMLENLNGKFTILGSAAEGLGIAIFSSFSDSLSGLVELGTNAISDLTSAFEEDGIAGMIECGMELVANFLNGIASKLPDLVPQAYQMVAKLADTIVKNLPTILDAGINVLKSLVQGIVNSLPIIIEEAPRIINQFCDAIRSFMFQLVLVGAEFIVKLVKGLWDNRGLILSNAGEIFKAFMNVFSLSSMINLGKSLLNSLVSGVSSLGSSMTSLGSKLINLLVNGIKSLISHPVTTMKNIIPNIKNAFLNTDWVSVGKNIISGIASGIKNAASSLVSQAVQAAKDAVSSVKGWLGIKSPSRRMRDEVGRYMAEGIGVGFERYMPTDDMRSQIEEAVNSLDVDAITAEIGTMFGGIQSEASRSVAVNTQNTMDQAQGGSTDYEEMLNVMTKFYSECIESTLNKIAMDTAKQANKAEKTIVQVGNRTVLDAVITQQKANGYSFTT